jgi:hypothetical protein
VVRQEGHDISLITYGGSLAKTMEANIVLGIVASLSYFLVEITISCHHVVNRPYGIDQQALIQKIKTMHIIYLSILFLVLYQY